MKSMQRVKFENKNHQTMKNVQSANSLPTSDAGLDLVLNCLTLWWYSWKNFLKKLIAKRLADDRLPSI